MTPQHSVSVAGVVVNAVGEVLLIERRDTGEWQIPGGVLELEEEVQAGLCREIREETGYQVEAEALTGVYKNMALGVVALVSAVAWSQVAPGSPTRRLGSPGCRFRR